MSSKLQHLLSSNKMKLLVQNKNKNMVFASFQRYFSMKHQNSKVQDLYDHCKNTFSPSGIPPPSSHALHKLSSILGMFLIKKNLHIFFPSLRNWGLWVFYVVVVVKIVGVVFVLMTLWIVCFWSVRMYLNELHSWTCSMSSC